MALGAVEARRRGASEDRIVFLGHATALIELAGVRLLTDPLLRDRVTFLRRQVAPVDTSVATPADAVLISHLHYDHLDLPSLRALGHGTRLLAPAGAGDWLGRKGFTDVNGLDVGDAARVGAVSVTAVPAHHDGHRLPGGVRAAALGYLIAGARTVYFAGDTERFQAMSEIAALPDVALLPVAGWAPKLGPGHMDPLQAAEAAALIKPRLAIPIHWGTLLPLGMSARHRHRLSDPPRLFAEHVARLAPDVEVCILAPGEQRTL